MKTATYTNSATHETYILKGIRDLEQAWNIAAFVCRRTGWNLTMFCFDVTVKVTESN